MTPDNVPASVIAKPFMNDSDFRRVRNLLDETYPITPTGFNWEVRRWDGWRYYEPDPSWNNEKAKSVRLWETEDGNLVGAVHPEGRGGNAFLQLHPHFRHIEEEMIVWAEDNLSSPADDGHHQLRIFVFEYDSPRKSLVERRGFEKTTSGGVIRRMRLGSQLIPRPELTKGYTLRTVNPTDNNDCRQIADLLNAAFNRDFHVAGEFKEFAAHALSYRQDLDLVAAAPDGTYAAYAGVPYNEPKRYGVFEPVCTHPDHLRLGLARTLMYEALHRLQVLKASDVYVGTGDQVAANRLYDSIGFTEAHKEYMWRKVF